MYSLYWKTCWYIKLFENEWAYDKLGMLLLNEWASFHPPYPPYLGWHDLSCSRKSRFVMYLCFLFNFVCASYFCIIHKIGHVYVLFKIYRCNRLELSFLILMCLLIIFHWILIYGLFGLKDLLTYLTFWEWMSLW